MEKPTYEEWCKSNPLTPEEENILSKHLGEIAEGVEMTGINQKALKMLEMKSRVLIVATRSINQGG